MTRGQTNIRADDGAKHSHQLSPLDKLRQDSVTQIVYDFKYKQHQHFVYIYFNQITKVISNFYIFQ